MWERYRWRSPNVYVTCGCEVSDDVPGVGCDDDEAGGGCPPDDCVWSIVVPLDGAVTFSNPGTDDN